MSILTPGQAKQYATSAGFSGLAADVIVAIAQAESGLNTLIRGTVDPRDRGILQINSYYHPEVLDSCAFDPACAFRAAYNISSGGTNFSPWTTFTSGAYQQFMGGGKSATTNVPTFLQSLYKFAVGKSGFWDISNPAARAANEGGIDIPNAGGTPVYALADGTLESNHLFWHNPPDVASYHGGNPGYGVISERVNIPGFGWNDLYYQHIDLNPEIPTCLGGDCSGITIHKGQLLGWTKSPDPGEVEIGVNPQHWGPVWGPDQHPGPWVDPETRIRALVDSDPAFQWGTQVTTGPVVSDNGNSGSADSVSSSLNSIPRWWIKIGLFLLALTLAGFGFYLLFQKQADAALKKSAEVAAKVALA
jgi:hypothetical protein